MNALTPEPIGKFLVICGLLYQAVTFLLPCCVYLALLAKKRPSVPTWASQHAWYFVFLTLNTGVFWLSMHSSNKLSLIETFGDWIVAGQIAGMALAGSLVHQWDINNPTISMERHPIRWGGALIIPLLMNLVALAHTIFNFEEQGSLKGTVWILMNLFAMAFYAIIAVRLPKPAKTRPPRLAFLWVWVILPLVSLTVVDITILRTRVSQSHEGLTAVHLNQQTTNVLVTTTTQTPN